MAGLDAHRQSRHRVRRAARAEPRAHDARGDARLLERRPPRARGHGVTVADDLALALELADGADAITTAQFRSASLVVETKPDMSPVTEADRGVERMVRSVLAERRPDDAVVGEEFGSSGPAS